MELVKNRASKLLNQGANGVGTNAGLNRPGRAEVRIKNLLQAAVGVQMLYQHAGVPSAEPAMAGCYCIDTTNDELYVCTDRSTPTWTKITE